MKYINTLIGAVLAGFVIGIGGMIYLSVNNKIIGASLFSIGLYVVVTIKFNLFTGRICYILEGNKVENLIKAAIIWSGNFIGSLLLALIIQATRISQGIEDKAVAICNVKYGDTYLSLFWLGVLCNIFIYIAVDEFKNNTHEIGKYIAIFLGVMGFILSGTEHCVADMFYIHMGKAYGGDMILRLFIITLGNIVGGSLSNCIIKYYKK